MRTADGVCSPLDGGSMEDLKPILAAQLRSRAIDSVCPVGPAVLRYLVFRNRSQPPTYREYHHGFSEQ